MTIVTIVDMSGEMSLGRLDPMTGKVGEPYKRKEYVSEIEKGWAAGVRAAVDGDHGMPATHRDWPECQDRSKPVYEHPCSDRAPFASAWR